MFNFSSCTLVPSIRRSSRRLDRVSLLNIFPPRAKSRRRHCSTQLRPRIRRPTGGVDESRLSKLSHATQSYVYNTLPEESSQKYPKTFTFHKRIPLIPYPLAILPGYYPLLIAALGAGIAKLVEACEGDERSNALALSNLVTKLRQLNTCSGDTHVARDRVGRHGLVTQ
eukprot:6068255-Pleurochrysis_carterae.AAC.1